MQDLFNAIFASYRDYWVEKIQPALAPTLTSLVLASLIVFVAWQLSRRLYRLSSRASSLSRADASTALLVGRIVQIGTLMLGGLLALGALGIQWAALITVIGAISVAISFAIQDVLKNFVAGLYLLVERPFRIGQELRVKEFVGRVETIGIRSTVLHTEDNVQVVVPNAVIFTEVLVNRSAYGGPVKSEPASEREDVGP